MNDNPYATPRSAQLHGARTPAADRALATRVALRGPERLVRSIGLVYFVQAVVAAAVGLPMLALAIRHAGAAPVALHLSTGVYLATLTTLLGIAGYGLRRLSSWSRLLALMHTLLLLGGLMFGLYALPVGHQVGFVFALALALPFYLLFSRRAGYVLSPEYRQVVAATDGHTPGSLALAGAIVALFVLLLAFDHLFLARLQ